MDAWRARSWDAILMDVHMPGMDGVEATKAIRAEERVSQRGRTPIIAVTASVLTHEVDAYRDAGMDDVLAKPIEASALAGMLARCVSL